MIRILLFLSAMMLAVAAHAVQPDEMLSDPVLEERAREVSQALRCVVCQNQDIDSSDAGIARDMRLLVRERILAGDTNQQVLDFMVDRYGSYVLLRPPFNATTALLWFSPVLIGLIAALVAIMVLRGARKAKQRRPEPLSPEEEAEVARALSEMDPKGSLK